MMPAIIKKLFFSLCYILDVVKLVKNSNFASKIIQILYQKYHGKRNNYKKRKLLAMV